MYQRFKVLQFAHALVNGYALVGLGVVKASLETIRNTASELIKDIDKNFAELTKDKEQAQAQETPGNEPVCLLLRGCVQVYVVQLGVCGFMYQRFKVLQFAHALVNGKILPHPPTPTESRLSLLFGANTAASMTAKQ